VVTERIAFNTAKLFQSLHALLLIGSLMTTSTMGILPEIDRLYHAFGRAMSEWASIEYYLSLFFSSASGLDFAMAQAVFFSGRSFQTRAEMLNASLQHSKLEKSWKEFVSTTLKKSISYARFRNKLAHGLFHPDALDGYGQPKDWKIKKAENWTTPGGISLDEIITAASNFEKFSMIMALAYYDLSKTTSPAKYMRQLNDLPNEAGANVVSQKQKGRALQNRASRT
jgi:hypothetical protein